MKPAHTIVFSSLFPNKSAPHAGAFIRERLFRVAKQMPITVVAPQPWFPLDFLIRKFRSSYRPSAEKFEVMDGVDVYRPTFFCVPSLFKKLDGYFMARGARKVISDLCLNKNIQLMDAHFLFPDGYAASILAREKRLPLTVTIRGSKDEWLIGTSREPYLKETLDYASKVISVSAALQSEVAAKLGTPKSKCTVIGNGVDLGKFEEVDKVEARKKLGIPPRARVLVSVGGLVERKGFHRIIPLLPRIRAQFPDLVFLIVGGGTTQADMSAQLTELAKIHGVSDIVRLCGSQPPPELKWYYGAADVFTLATSHEGWANVFLEAMACGLPVVTTAVGGNAEVVLNRDLGVLVPYFDDTAFCDELISALRTEWNREKIVEYAKSNTWDDRVRAVVEVFSDIIASREKMNRP
jgi:teichuronic acid biosynthesis glycosyltransferase TuaC